MSQLCWHGGTSSIWLPASSRTITGTLTCCADTLLTAIPVALPDVFSKAISKLAITRITRKNLVSRLPSVVKFRRSKQQTMKASDLREGSMITFEHAIHRDRRVADSRVALVKFLDPRMPRCSRLADSSRRLPAGKKEGM